MTNRKEIATFGYAVGLAANDMGTAFAPVVLQNSSFFQKLPLIWKSIFYIKQGSPHLEAIPFIVEACTKLGEGVKETVKAGHPFLVFGGDHSCAIGTWSGASAALHDKGTLGLIWIDAHLDSHTHETTLSGNIHGMSLAALLGKGDKTLTTLLSDQQKILPENICVIGARSFEVEELELLEGLRVKIYFMEEIRTKGLSTIIAEAITLVTKTTAGFGVTIDVDALDPEEAPGVGTQAEGGLRTDELLKVCPEFVKNPHFIGLEVVEFNPLLDKDQKTERVVAELVGSVFGWKEK